MRAGGVQQCVTVSRGLGQCFRANDGVASRAVVNDGGLSQVFGELLSEQSGDRIRAAARRKGQQDANLLVGVRRLPDGKTTGNGQADRHHHAGQTG